MLCFVIIFTVEVELYSSLMIWWEWCTCRPVAVDPPMRCTSVPVFYGSRCQSRTKNITHNWGNFMCFFGLECIPHMICFSCTLPSALLEIFQFLSNEFNFHNHLSNFVIIGMLRLHNLAISRSLNPSFLELVFVFLNLGFKSWQYGISLLKEICFPILVTNASPKIIAFSRKM